MANLKNILVLGATGLTGLVFVKEALLHPSQPHLTLLVRTPSKCPTQWLSHPRLTIIEGGLNDPTTASKAMQNVTSVISFLGAYISLNNFLTRDKSTPIGDALEATILPAMRNAGVKRIVALSSPGGLRLPGDNVPYGKYWLFSYVAPKAMVPAGSAEMTRIGEVVSQAGDDLDWTVFRIPNLNDGDEEGKLKVVASENCDGAFLKEAGLDLSRGSLVKWLLREIEEGKWVHKAPVVGNPW